MLKQLLKHEWIATARKYSLFYIVLAAVTLFTGLVSLIESENVVLTTMKGLIIGVYVITLVGMWFCSIGYAVVRFYKNMVSGEGYLTFTLPVTVPQLLISKLLVAFVWQLVTIAAILISVLGLLGIHGHWDMIGTVVEQVLDTYKSLPVAVIFMFLGSMLYQLMVYYCSIAIGQTFTGNKIAGSIIGYVILYVSTEVIMLGGVFAIGLIVGIDDINAYANSVDGMPMLFGVTGALMAVFAGIVFYITNRIFTKKLNLN